MKCNTVFISSICYHLFILQWNPLNTVANGAKKNWPYKRGGRVNEVFFYKKMYGNNARPPKKSGRNNEVTVLLRWP